MKSNRSLEKENELSLNKLGWGRGRLISHICYTNIEMTPPHKIDYKKFKKRLEAARDELQHLETLTKEGRKPVELDQTQQGRLSRMDAIQVQEMALEQERRRQLELLRINAALQRIGNGEYGFCNRCGEEIEIKRLEISPSNPLCLDCAQA